jgi:hypothetical protein
MMTMVVCLKQVCFTDLFRDWFNISVKKLASWSAHARRMRLGKSSGPVNLFKGLASATESVITQSSGTAGAVMHVSMLLASMRA